MKALIPVILLACSGTHYDENSKSTEGIKVNIVIDINKKKVSEGEVEYKITKINDGYIVFSEKYNNLYYRSGNIDRITGVARLVTYFRGKDGKDKAALTYVTCKKTDKLF